MVIVWVDTENIYNWSPIVDLYHNNISEVKLFLGHNKYSDNVYRYFDITYSKVTKYYCEVGFPDALDYELLNTLYLHVSNNPLDRHLVLSNDRIYHKHKYTNILYYSTISKYSVSVRKNILRDFLIFER